MTTRAQNRADFPIAAQCVDEFRAVFGPDVKLAWALENGREIGQRSLNGIVVVAMRRSELRHGRTGME